MSDLQDDLKRRFDLVALRHAAEKLDGADWATYQSVQESFAKERRQLEAQHKEARPRLEAEERARLNEAARKRAPELKPGWARGASQDEIAREARARVARAKEGAEAEIDRRESEALKFLVDRAGSRRAKETFNRESQGRARDPERKR